MVSNEQLSVHVAPPDAALLLRPWVLKDSTHQTPEAFVAGEGARLASSASTAPEKEGGTFSLWTPITPRDVLMIGTAVASTLLHSLGLVRVAFPLGLLQRVEQRPVQDEEEADDDEHPHHRQLEARVLSGEG